MYKNRQKYIFAISKVNAYKGSDFMKNKKIVGLLMATLIACPAASTSAAIVNVPEKVGIDRVNNDSINTAAHQEFDISIKDPGSGNTGYTYDKIRIVGVNNAVNDPVDYFKIRVNSTENQYVSNYIRFTSSDDASYEVSIYDSSNNLRGQFAVSPNSLGTLSNIFTPTNEYMYIKVRLTNDVQPQTPYEFIYKVEDIFGASSMSELNLETNDVENENIQYETNENGETYGFGCYEEELGGLPDLIKAIGVDEIVGYVRQTDLNEDAQTIPLYDKDGQTVLGEFELKANFEESFDISE